MPNLIFESFYIKTLAINATGIPQNVKPARQSPPFVLESYQQSVKFRVSGELDTLGNIHSVYTPDYQGLKAVHPVRLEGCPHIIQIVLWILPIDAKDPHPRPWETFNATPAMQQLAAHQYPKIRQGGITFKHYEDRDKCFSLLKEWIVAKWTGYSFMPSDFKPPDEIPGVFINTELADRIDGCIVMHPGQAFKFKDGEMVP